MKRQKHTKKQLVKPNIPNTNGMSELVKKTFNVRKEGDVVIYSIKLHDELVKIRERTREIFEITKPLRKEQWNLSRRHNEILEQITGVKIQ